MLCIRIGHIYLYLNKYISDVGNEKIRDDECGQTKGSFCLLKVQRYCPSAQL